MQRGIPLRALAPLLASLWLGAAPALADDGPEVRSLASEEALALPQDRTAPAPPRTSEPAGTSRTAPAPPRPERTAPAPAPPGGTAPAPPHSVRPAPPGHPGYYWREGAWYYDPFFWWMGWGLDWGFYPLYPEPPPPEPGYEPPPPRLTSELAFQGGPTRRRDSGAGILAGTGNAESIGVSFALEGERFGGSVALDGFCLTSLEDADDSNTLQIATAHFTWAFLAGASGRLRAEAGASLASWPTAAPFGSALSVGPDLGLSGRVMLLGPLGFQGYARATPFPRLLVDLSAMAVLRFGPVAFTGGWRDLSLKGDGAVPSLRFAGPQFGLSLLL